MSSELTTTTENLPVGLDDLEKLAGKGGEEAGAQDRRIPTLVIVQALSPQKQEASEAYIEGCEEGDIINTLTKEIHKDGVELLCVKYRNVFHLLKDDGEQGEFIEELEPTDPRLRGTERRDEKDFVPSMPGHYIQTIARHYCIQVGEGRFPQPTVVNFKVTGKKASKAWIGLLDARPPMPRKDGGYFNAPWWLWIFRLGSTNALSKRNKPYKAWTVDFVGQCEDGQAFAMGTEMHRAIGAGEIQVHDDQGMDVDPEGNGGTPQSAASRPSPPPVSDDEIPY